MEMSLAIVNTMIGKLSGLIRYWMGSVPKDGREGLANRISVRLGIQITPCEWADLIIRFSKDWKRQIVFASESIII